MTLSVRARLDPVIEARLEQEAKRLGVTNSEFMKDALERVLGLKDPASLLKLVCSGVPMGDPDASEDVSGKMRAKLNAKRST